MLEAATGQGNLEVVYEDDDLMVLHKPAELLSVPGKNVRDSVLTRLQAKHPDWDGPIIVHRLDMSTSGLLVVAKTKRAHRFLQQQFIKKKVEKRYVALLSRPPVRKSGIIELPLRVDLDNRPQQLVCYEHGKPAVTRFEIVEVSEKGTRVHFYPITGRTHQLRVHAAHAQGLNSPIIGDDLYGRRDQRLHLHAEQLRFMHPTNREQMTFICPAPF